MGNRFLRTVLCLVLAGCSLETGSPADPKAEAADARRLGDVKADGADGADPCAENAWYGDGVCDWFCQLADQDCDWLPTEVPEAIGEPGPSMPSEWNHSTLTPLKIGGGQEHHSAVEPVVNPGQSIVLSGKFAYGLFSKDLEDEEVVAYVYVGPDAGWVEAGRGYTDDDGRILIPVDPYLVASTGYYDFRMVVLGDLTRARGRIWVVEPGRHAVVFDIDGTLTTSDLEIVEEVLFGVDPEMYPYANDVARMHADAGLLPVYVTGRGYRMNKMSRRWLEAHSFPVGPLRTTDNGSQSAASRRGVGAYKRDYLLSLERDEGLVFDLAYGNATTDICAYAEAGIDPASTFIIGPNAGRSCDGYPATNALVSYADRL